MRKNSKHTCDERYLRTEAKIQNTIDTMFINQKVVTKVRDFCASAGINPATFYGHYESIGDVIFERDRREAESLKNNLASASNLDIAFQKAFHYAWSHQAYFKSITARDNICLYKNLIITIKPVLLKLKNWREYYEWDENRGMKLEKVCHKLTFEVAGEYNEWIEYDKFDRTKIRPHVKRLVYLSSTACQRLDH